ncbi:MAG: nucleotidyl transferase AbiEii/AbiGii toxin family protein [Candidatus Cloacimonadota bacterium]|nr:nucleotidyl transferase AbiEii/AbiGii toxin family protein [Candidatus Cloacimonadota bacterium]
MSKNIKNMSASVRTRLLKIAKDNSRNFNAVLLQYFQERLLYRLSISPYKNKFILKGALLFLVYKIPGSRPTKDIDFLGIETANNEENLLSRMSQIVKIKVNDGVEFDPKSLTSEIIKEDEIYPGTRIHCLAYLGQAKMRFHIDIGFGDKVVPNPVMLDFPVFLMDMPVPKLIAYSPESAIAEKFEAIVNLGFTTSRMKDFFDIYHLASHQDFELQILREAIKTTFNNRQTKLSSRLEIYSENFINNVTKKRQWEAFIRKMRIDDDLSFQDCMSLIKKFIEPVLENFENKFWRQQDLNWIIPPK